MSEPDLTPEQMAEKLRGRARDLRRRSASPTPPTVHLLDEAANLIDRLAMENVVLVAEQRYCSECKSAPGERCDKTCTSFRNARI